MTEYTPVQKAEQLAGDVSSNGSSIFSALLNAASDCDMRRYWKTSAAIRAAVVILRDEELRITAIRASGAGSSDNCK